MIREIPPDTVLIQALVDALQQRIYESESPLTQSEARLISNVNTLVTGRWSE